MKTNAMEGIEDLAAARLILDSPRTVAATDMLDVLKMVAETLGQQHILLPVVRRVIAKAEGK